MNRSVTLFLLLLLGLRVAQATTYGVRNGLGHTGTHSPRHLASRPAGAATQLGRVAGGRPLAETDAAPAAWAKLGLGSYTWGQTPSPALSVYPNPARGQTTVQISGPGGADYQLRLSNVLGSEVRRLPVRPENSPAEGGVALDLSTLPPGLYFCSLLVNEKTMVTKRLTVL